jgi:hypothetical protein
MKRGVWIVLVVLVICSSFVIAEDCPQDTDPCYYWGSTPGGCIKYYWGEGTPCIEDGENNICIWSELPEEDFAIEERRGCAPEGSCVDTSCIAQGGYTINGIVVPPSNCILGTTHNIITSFDEKSLKNSNFVCNSEGNWDVCGDNKQEGDISEGGEYYCDGNEWTIKELDCTDGADEEEDGLTDCLDDDCDGVMGPDGFLCEFNENTCDDTLDNDYDNLMNCDDPDCLGQQCAIGGSVCATKLTFIQSGVPGSPLVVCKEADCNDKIDNNDNELTDCQDQDCAGVIVGPNGEKCESPAELTCNDGFDNDGDYTAYFPTPLKPIGPPTIAEYRFDGDITDENSNYDGTPQNIIYQEGIVDQSIYFHKPLEPSYVTLPPNILDGLTDFTIMMWVKVYLHSGNDDTLISAANTAEHNEFLIHGVEDAIIYVKGESQNTGYSLVNNGQFTHLAITRASGTINMFINGELVKQLNGFTTAPLFVQSLVLAQKQDHNKEDQEIIKTIGETTFTIDTSQDFGGNIDQLRFYDAVLSTTQIKNIYQNESENNPVYFSDEWENSIEYDENNNGFYDLVNSQFNPFAPLADANSCFKRMNDKYDNIEDIYISNKIKSNYITCVEIYKGIPIIKRDYSDFEGEEIFQTFYHNEYNNYIYLKIGAPHFSECESYIHNDNNFLKRFTSLEDIKNCIDEKGESLHIDKYPYNPNINLLEGVDCTDLNCIDSTGPEGSKCCLTDDDCPGGACGENFECYETNCADKTDNDGNTLADCQDPLCDNKFCKDSALQDFICVKEECVGFPKPPKAPIMPQEPKQLIFSYKEILQELNKCQVIKEEGTCNDICANNNQVCILADAGTRTCNQEGSSKCTCC